MAESDPLAILLAHDRWSTEHILRACASLTPEQFHRRFEIGPGSLHDTILHILAAMRTWIETLEGKTPGPRLEAGGERTVAELGVLLEQCADDLAREAARLPLSDTVSRPREGRVYHFTRGLVVTHVATHGMYHRAQCVNMLRQLGVKPLPPTGMAEWSRSVDAPDV